MCSGIVKVWPRRVPLSMSENEEENDDDDDDDDGP